MKFIFRMRKSIVAGFVFPQFLVLMTLCTFTSCKRGEPGKSVPAIVQIDPETYEKFMKEAPVAWSEYRSRLNNCRVHGLKYSCPFEAICADNVQTFKRSFTPKRASTHSSDFNYFLGATREKAFSIEWKRLNEFSTDVKFKATELEEYDQAVRVLMMQIDPERFALLSIDGGLIDELLESGEATVTSAVKHHSGENQLVKVTMSLSISDRDGNKPETPETVTVLLDPAKYWTIVLFQQNKSEGNSRINVDHEISTFQGVPVSQKETRVSHMITTEATLISLSTREFEVVSSAQALEHFAEGEAIIVEKSPDEGR